MGTVRVKLNRGRDQARHGSNAVISCEEVESCERLVSEELLREGRDHINLVVGVLRHYAGPRAVARRGEDTATEYDLGNEAQPPFGRADHCCPANSGSTL